MTSQDPGAGERFQISDAEDWELVEARMSSGIPIRIHCDVCRNTSRWCRVIAARQALRGAPIPKTWVKAEP